MKAAKKTKRTKKRKKTKISHVIKGILILFFWLSTLGVVVFLSAFAYYARQLPDPESIITRRISEATKIFDRTGEKTLYTIHGDEKRTIIPIEAIADSAQYAIVAAEDATFYEHSGLDLRGIARAAVKNIENRSIVQGGSTITQQLIENSLLGKNRSVAGKFKETILALEVERKFSKDEILWMYLNQISYGSNIYGIESASQGYFGKPASELDLHESALLAAIINAPTYFSPYGSNAEELYQRKNTILHRMYELGYITADERDDAINAEYEFEGQNIGILAPHFVIMVREYLVKKYGNDLVENGGLRVYTTLDWNLQEKAAEAIDAHVESNEKNLNAGNASLVAVDPKTGHILALVGSRDYFDTENDGNFNTALALRQPGSSFKPIAYSVALDKGYTDKTIVFDVPTEFNPDCDPDGRDEKDQYGLDCYHPQNYTGRYLGPVTLRQALANSLNVPAVKVLYLAGISDVIARAQDLGITSFNDPSRFGLALVLGGAEIRLRELVGAYAAYANDGVFNETTFITKIETSDGRILEEYRESPRRVIPEQTARTINDMLSDNFARAQIFGLNNYLNISEYDVAAKTGTTQDNRDAWTIGYTPAIAAGVWVGNNDNSQMTSKGVGVTAAGPIWRTFMTSVLPETSEETFTLPEPVFSNKIMLNGNYILRTSEDSREVNTILYYVNKNAPLGPMPSNPSVDPQFNNWQWAVKRSFGIN